MKKILFIHNTAAEYRIPFFEELSSGKTVSVEYLFTKIHLNEKNYGNKVNDDKLNKVKYKILKNKFNICYELIPLLIKEKYDGAFIPSMDSFGEYIDSVIAFIILKIRNKKIFYFTEAWQAESKVPLKKRIKNYVRKSLTKFFIRNCDAIVCSGSKAKEYMVDVLKVKENKCFIAYDASETEDIEFNYELKEELNITKSKIIMYYGRIIDRKGLDILIYAFNKVKDKYDDIYLLIAGDGEYTPVCKKIASDIGLKDYKFIGAVDPKLRRKYFSQIDLFVLPSKNHEGTIEAWGLTVNEAMENAVPVIATDAVGAAYDMISNGINGYMIKENNIDELVYAIEKCIESNEILENMKINAKKTTKDEFNYKSMAMEFTEIINKFI